MWKSGLWIAFLCVVVQSYGNDVEPDVTTMAHTSVASPIHTSSDNQDIATSQITLPNSNIVPNQVAGKSTLDIEESTAVSGSSPNTTAASATNITTTTTTTTTVAAAAATTTTTTTTTAAATSIPSSTTISSSSTTTITTTTTPTTTVLPPLPSPTTGHYNVRNDNNTTCILADLAVQIAIVHDNKTLSFDMPATASSNLSFCNNSNEDLILSWSENNKTTNLVFQFIKNETNNQYMVSKIDLETSFANGTSNFTNEKNEFVTSLKKSYRCDKEQQIKLSDKSNSTYALLKISHVHLQAFDFKDNGTFGSVEDCAGSSSPDIVPIAVGCALVGLVAIVLIAYLVGRRRSQARGYLSM